MDPGSGACCVLRYPALSIVDMPTFRLGGCCRRHLSFCFLHENNGHISFLLCVFVVRTCVCVVQRIALLPFYTWWRSRREVVVLFRLLLCSHPDASGSGGVAHRVFYVVPHPCAECLCCPPHTIGQGLKDPVEVRLWCVYAGPFLAYVFDVGLPLPPCLLESCRRQQSCSFVVFSVFLDDCSSGVSYECCRPESDAVVR